MKEIETVFDEVDRTKAFTPDMQEQVNKLPREQRYSYMARPNSKVNMPQDEIEKHYQSQNYPEHKYYSSGGGGSGSLTPPKSKR